MRRCGSLPFRLVAYWRRRHFTLPAWSSPYLCPRTPGTSRLWAPRRDGRGRTPIPGTRDMPLPLLGRAASSRRYAAWGSSSSNDRQPSSPAPLIKNELARAGGSGSGLGAGSGTRWLPAITARMSSVARKRPSASRRAPLMVHCAIRFVVFIPVAPAMSGALSPPRAIRTRRVPSIARYPLNGAVPIPRTSLLRTQARSPVSLNSTARPGWRGRSLARAATSRHCLLIREVSRRS